MNIKSNNDDVKRVRIFGGWISIHKFVLIMLSWIMKILDVYVCECVLSVLCMLECSRLRNYGNEKL
jgi:hypothetical protein